MDPAHTTPPATNIKTKIQDATDDIEEKLKELSNVTRNISQLQQDQKYFDDYDYLQYLVEKEKEYEKELTFLTKRKQDIQDPKTHTKKRRFMPLKPSRVKSLSLGRLRQSKKKYRSNSLGGKRKRKTRK